MAVDGCPENVKFNAVANYPTGIPMSDGWRVRSKSHYYALNVISIGNSIYQYVSTSNDEIGDDLKPWNPEFRWRGTKLIYSPDNGATWSNQDGSKPVTWQSPQDLSRDNTIFWKEKQNIFSELTLLQMGKGYRDNKDGHVYGYSHNETSNETLPRNLCMFRVPKTRLLQRDAYEFYAGLGANGAAVWKKDIEAIAPVPNFPREWEVSSVVYNAPLNLYMMVAYQVHGLDTPEAIVKELYRPSSMGFWTSRHPWGPWEQIHEEAKWTPGGDSAAWCEAPIIAPKWISADGKSLWLVWTDWGHSKAWRESLGEEVFYSKTASEYVKRYAEYFEAHPKDRFLMQRVDLIVG